MNTQKYDKSKRFKFADGYYFTCYYKTNGPSFEVGISYEDKTVFFGNFIYKSEALAWYKEMLSAMTYFVENYQYMPNMKMAWYFSFAKNYFYNSYYMYLDQAFSKYNQEFKKAYTSDKKAYKKFESSYDVSM